jgi:hypothetical protein
MMAMQETPGVAPTAARLYQILKHKKAGKP